MRQPRIQRRCGFSASKTGDIRRFPEIGPLNHPCYHLKNKSIKNNPFGDPPFMEPPPKKNVAIIANDDLVLWHQKYHSLIMKGHYTLW